VRRREEGPRKVREQPVGGAWGTGAGRGEHRREGVPRKGLQVCACMCSGVGMYSGVCAKVRCVYRLQVYVCVYVCVCE